MAGRSIVDTPEAGGAAIRGAGLRALGYGVGVLLSIASAAVLFRHLGVVDGGRYVLVLSLVTIAQGLTESGLTAIGMRELAVVDVARREELMRALLGLRLVLTTLGVLGAAAFALAAGYASVLVVGTLVAGVGLIVQMQQNMLSVVLMVDLRAGWVTVLDLLRQVLAVVLVIVLVVLGASLLPLLAISIPAGVVVLAVTAWVLKDQTPLRPSFALSEWRELTRDILPYALATAVNVIYFRVAIVVTSLVATRAQVGYFAASFRVVEVLVMVPGLLVSTTFPILSRAARDDPARLRYATQRTFEASSALGVAVALGLSLGAPFVISVVAGPDFAPAASVLRIQAIALAATFPAVAWTYALLSLRRHRELLVMNAVALVLAAAVTLVLAQSDGARGAAVATVVGEAALCLIAGWTLSRARRDLRPQLGHLPRIVAAAAVGAAVALIPGLPPIVDAVAGMAVYGLVLWRLGGIPEELLVEVRRRRAPA